MCRQCESPVLERDLKSSESRMRAGTCPRCHAPRQLDLRVGLAGGRGQVEYQRRFGAHPRDPSQYCSPGGWSNGTASRALFVHGPARDIGGARRDGDLRARLRPGGCADLSRSADQARGAVRRGRATRRGGTHHWRLLVGAPRHHLRREPAGRRRHHSRQGGRRHAARRIYVDAGDLRRAVDQCPAVPQCRVRPGHKLCPDRP